MPCGVALRRVSSGEVSPPIAETQPRWTPAPGAADGMMRRSPMTDVDDERLSIARVTAMQGLKT